MEENKPISGETTQYNAYNVFNFVVSHLRNGSFRQPEFLGNMLCDLMPHLRDQYIKIANWNMNYALGFMFTMLYAKLLKDIKSSPNMQNALFLGLISGLALILSLKIARRLSLKSPISSPWALIRNMWMAQALLGVVSALAYKILDRESYKAKITQADVVLIQ